MFVGAGACSRSTDIHVIRVQIIMQKNEENGSQQSYTHIQLKILFTHACWAPRTFRFSLSVCRYGSQRLQEHTDSEAQSNQRHGVGRRDLARRCDQLKVLQITTRDKQRQDSILSLLDRRKKRIALAKGNLTLRLSEKYSSQFVPEENYMMLSR